MGGAIRCGRQRLDIAAYDLKEDQSILDSISQKSNGFVGQVYREATGMRMVFPALDAELTGATAADGQSLSGAWKQNSAKLDMVLSQAERFEQQLRRSAPDTSTTLSPRSARGLNRKSQSGHQTLRHAHLTFCSYPSSFSSGAYWWLRFVVSEYAEIEQTLAPEVLKTIAGWLQAQFAQYVAGHAS